MNAAASPIIKETAMSRLIQVALTDLHPSADNVRPYDPDADTALPMLAATMASVGQLQALTVKPREQGSGYEIVAGRRRWEAAKRAVEQRPSLAMLDAMLLERPEDAAEVSLAENYARKAMSLPEVYQAFAAIRAQRPAATLEELGAMFGFDVARAGRIMRLANLAPAVMAAYAAGSLNDSQAQAFASTEDHEAQQRVLGELAGVQFDHQRSAAAIRRMLGGMDQDQATMLRFAGQDAYEAAGGRFDVDLFDDAGGRVLDPVILKAVFDRAVAEAKDAFERRLKRNGRRIVTNGSWGLRDLDFQWVDAPPQKKEYGYLTTDHDLLIRNPKVEPAGSTIDTAETIILPKKGTVVGIGKIEAGAFKVSLWYASRAAKGMEDPKAIGKSATGEKSPAEKQRLQYGLTKDGMGAMMMLRRDMIREQLIEEACQGGTLGLDFMIYSQARTILRPSGTTWDGRPTYSGSPQGIMDPASQDDSGMKAPASTRRVYDTLSAGSHYRDVMDQLAQEPWCVHHDPVAGLDLYLAATQDVKDRAAALVACHGLMAAPTFYGDPQTPRAIEALAGRAIEATGVPWADTVTYDAAFFEVISHKKRLELLDSWGLGERAKTLKKVESAAFCAQAHAAAGDDVEAARLGIADDDRGEISLWRPDWLDHTSVAPLPAPEVSDA